MITTIFFLILILFINLSLVYSKTMTNLLSLVLTIFFSSIGIFIFLGVEFLMFAYMIIYIGAIIVMFLFVVMLINVKEENLKNFFTDDFFLITIINFFFVFFLYFISYSSFTKNNKSIECVSDDISLKTHFRYSYDDISVLGEYLFTHCSFPFIVSSLVLFVATVISISICLIFSKSEIK